MASESLRLLTIADLSPDLSESAMLLELSQSTTTFGSISLARTHAASGSTIIKNIARNAIKRRRISVHLLSPVSGGFVIRYAKNVKTTAKKSAAIHAIGENAKVSSIIFFPIKKGGSLITPYYI
jgi:hypothetical protein